jgi:hypothetical protein
MYVIGHVAAALLAARRWDLDARIAIGAALFPDLVDKTLRYGLGVVPSGRVPAHSLLVAGLATGGVALLGRRKGRAGRWAKSWAAGYGLHLAFDFAAQVPLLWPFVPYKLKGYKLSHVLWHRLEPIEVTSAALEVALVVAALNSERRRLQTASQDDGPKPRPPDAATSEPRH